MSNQSISKKFPVIFDSSYIQPTTHSQQISIYQSSILLVIPILIPIPTLPYHHPSNRLITLWQPSLNHSHLGFVFHHMLINIALDRFCLNRAIGYTSFRVDRGRKVLGLVLGGVVLRGGVVVVRLRVGLRGEMGVGFTGCLVFAKESIGLVLELGCEVVEARLELFLGNRVSFRFHE